MTFYIFWYIFMRKQKFDVTYVNKMKLVDAGQRGCPHLIQGRRIMISGDKGHTRIIYGTIIGYCRIQILTRNIDFDKTGVPKTRRNPKTGELEPIYILGQEEQDVFIIKQRTGILGMFEEPEVIRISPGWCV